MGAATAKRKPKPRDGRRRRLDLPVDAPTIAELAKAAPASAELRDALASPEAGAYFASLRDSSGTPSRGE